MAGMESLPVDQGKIGIVKVVTDQGKAQVFHMDADLVGASGFQFQGNQAVSL